MDPVLIFVNDAFNPIRYGVLIKKGEGGRGLKANRAKYVLSSTINVEINYCIVQGLLIFLNNAFNPIRSGL